MPNTLLRAGLAGNTGTDLTGSVVRNRDIQWAANPEGMLSNHFGMRLVITRFGVTHSKEFTTAQYKKRDRTMTDAALEFLLTAVDPIPYDVEHIAHEL